MKFIHETIDVFKFLWNVISGLILLVSFIVVPYGFPFLGIYMLCENKRYFRFISGQVVLLLSFILLVVWLYPFTCGEQLFDYANTDHFSLTEILNRYRNLFSALIVSYCGMLLFLLRGNYEIARKQAGVVLFLIGAYFFANLLIGKMFDGI